MLGWHGVRLGPFALLDGRFEMRTPRLSDGPAWSQARLANRKWLERAFPAWGDDWEAEQSPTAWVQRWWHLRREAASGRAFPFVLLLEGRLIGEIGVDALDEISNSGEASVWMVREHGTADVMVAASRLLIHHSFTAPRPIDRLLSPVATAAREGRTPGLTACGLQIEGTVARRVGGKGMVDHDLWVAHNTAESRAKVARQLSRLAPAPDTARADKQPVTAMAKPLVRAALRETRGAVQGIRPADLLRRDRTSAHGAPRTMEVEPIVRDGRRVGEVWSRADPGTGIYEIVVSSDPGTADEVLTHALKPALDATPAGLRATVRVPSDPRGRRVPDEGMLRAAGLTHVATFPGNPEGPSGWAGEQQWQVIS